MPHVDGGRHGRQLLPPEGCVPHELARLLALRVSRRTVGGMRSPVPPDLLIQMLQLALTGKLLAEQFARQCPFQQIDRLLNAIDRHE